MASTSTFTIQPWTPQSTNTNTLQDVLSRAQRGHLRDITESSLQEEIVAEDALDLSDASSTSDSDDDAEPETKQPLFGKPSTREDLYNARRYMLETLAAGLQQVDIAKDLMSLIVSKEIPKQAYVTMGKHVKEKVPLGTMGVDFWQRMPIDQAREAQDALLAANVKMEGLQSSADGLLGAAKRMEEDVRRETQYWDQILSISSRGWNVCRVPGQQHRLGVRFGFSESAAQFSRKGIAALNPDREGGIRLERGIGSKPKALRATLRREGRVVGTSRVPEMRGDAEETTLEARIRYARDSLFDEELYHEIIRESRTLASLGVAIEGSTVRLRHASPDAGDGLEVEFDLVALDEDNSLPDADATRSEKDTLAQTTILAARLLLSHAHRDRLRKRSEPPAPLSERQKDDKPIIPILRPIISLMLHHSALDQLSRHLITTSRALTVAKIEHTVEQPQLPLLSATESDSAEGNTITTAESLLTCTLLRPLTSSATLTMGPAPLAQDAGPPSPSQSQPDSTQTFTLTLETSPSNAFGTVFMLHTSSPPNAAEGKARTLHFQDLSTFNSATSAFLARALADALLPFIQHHRQDPGEASEWHVRENEAVVEKDVGVGEVEEEFVVELDVEGGLKEGQERGKVRLMYQGNERKEFSWPPADDGDGKEDGGFFEVARACLAES